MRNLHKVLKAGGCVIGSWINSASPIVAELMASVGFDFLTIDTEHSAVGLPQTQLLFQAIRSGNPDCAALVRLPGNLYDVTKQYMDAGADGVIAPLINTAQQASELIGSIKYPPEGIRGVGYCRANMYGTDFDRAMAESNQHNLVCVQIEHIEAVSNIDEILSTPGVDAAFIGPYDLTASMGIVGQFDNPKTIAAMDRILDACLRHGVAPGIHVVKPNIEEVLTRIKQGYRFIAFSLDITMLATCCTSSLKAIRKAMES